MATSAIHSGDDVNSLEEANTAVLNNDMALRIQPPAPGATRYYYLSDEKGWTFRKCGHKHGSSVSVKTVREAVKRAIQKNDAAGGGGVTAVEKERVGRYA